MERLERKIAEDTMKKFNKYFKKSLLVLLALLMAALTACSRVKAECLTSGMEKSAVPIVGRETDETFVRHYTVFAQELFKNAVVSGENSLISPLSVMLALAMTANGAGGETLSGMLRAIAGGMDAKDLNDYIRFILNELPNEKKCKVVPANSIWIRSGYGVEEAFLRTDVDYYDADVFRAPFNDGTVRDINNWVKKNTDGMIDGIIDSIDPLTVMFLINALIFDAEWSSKYQNSDVNDAEFHLANGETKTVSMMYSNEYSLIAANGARGFIKNYAERYAFAAILPDEGTDLDSFIGTLDGETLYNILHSARSASVTAGIPKFKYEFSTSLKSALEKMGMADAFTDKADFTGISRNEAPHIDDVLHKTFIEVAENGTRAGAVTAIPMNAEGCFEERDEIILDRPFLYVIFDRVNGMPLFIGTVNDIDL